MAGNLSLTAVYSGNADFNGTVNFDDYGRTDVSDRRQRSESRQVVVISASRAISCGKSQSRSSR